MRLKATTRRKKAFWHRLNLRNGLRSRLMSEICDSFTFPRFDKFFTFDRLQKMCQLLQ